MTFAEPVTNRARAEQSVDITSDKTPTGKFTWLSNQIVQWTPDQFWPAHSPISVTAGGFSTSFETGSAVVGIADVVYVHRQDRRRGGSRDARIDG